MSRPVPASRQAVAWLDGYSERTQAEAARLFGVSPQAISRELARQGQTRIPLSERARTARAVEAERQRCMRIGEYMAARLPLEQARAVRTVLDAMACPATTNEEE